MVQRSHEFQRGWTIILAAASGVGLGVAGLFTYNAGLFVHDLGPAIGLNRATFGVAFFGSTLALALAMPLVGRAVDRFGPRATAAFGAICLALGFTVLGALVRTPAAYVLVMVLTGLFASGSSPVAYSRVVSGAFSRHRGVALGLTQVGIGIAAAVVPAVVSVVIGDHGWRAGFWVLAAISALGLLPALALPSRDLTAASEDPATAFRTLRGSALFTVQFLAFVSMALAFAGMLPHFVPMLREAGLSARQAGGLAGLIGISVIVTRVIVGWLADRLQPAYLGAACCALCAIGCLALAFGGAQLAAVGAIALGTAMGAEADLLGILTARYFALAAYSRAFSVQYAGFMVAAGIGPMWVGFIADRTGSYTPALMACGGMLVLPIILFLLLPRLEAAAKSSSAART